jgi:hypothetical protein
MNTTLKGADYYEIIRNRPALKWLLRQGELVKGMNPLEEYDWVKSRIQAFEDTEYYLLLCLFGLFFDISLVLTIAVYRIGAPFGLMVGSALLIIGIALGWVVNKFFSKPWDDFIRLWINENWKSKRFCDEIDTIIQSLCSNMTGTTLLHRLEGDMSEVERGCVPQCVQYECGQYLIDRAKVIKGLDRDGIAHDGYRKSLKHKFGIFKRFNIIAQDIRLDFYYTMALRRIEQESNKSAVVA